MYHDLADQLEQYLLSYQYFLLNDENILEPCMFKKGARVN